MKKTNLKIFCLITVVFMMISLIPTNVLADDFIDENLISNEHDHDCSLHEDEAYIDEVLVEEEGNCGPGGCYMITSGNIIVPQSGYPNSTYCYFIKYYYREMCVGCSTIYRYDWLADEAKMHLFVNGKCVYNCGK